MPDAVPSVPTLVQITGLRKVYPGGKDATDRAAVDGIDLTVRTGDSLAIVGQSGSGKTTCARIIAGAESATEGQVLLNGSDFTRRSVTRRERKRRAQIVQMVFQDHYSSLDPRHTVAESVMEVLAEYKPGRQADRRAQAASLIEECGLDPRALDAYPRQLSGGQRQRAAIAKALAISPKLVVLDEPVSALDVSVQAQILNLLHVLREQEGLTYIFITHDLGVARQISDDCVVMHRGKIVERGKTPAVLDSPQHSYTRELIAAVPRPGWAPRRRVAQMRDTT
jgi:ABC-type glutathione transport system ATPase component